MGYESYVGATGLLDTVGEPLVAFAAGMALATLIASALSLRGKGTSGLARTFQLITLASLGICFLLVINLHLAIHSIEIGAGDAGFRFSVAPWTESEKPLFWALLLGLASASIWRGDDDRVAPLTSSLFGAFVLLMAIFDPPFTRPLPTLQTAIEAWHSTGGGLSLYRELRGLEAFYGSGYMWIHPPALFASYTALVVTLAGSLLMLTGRDGWSPTYGYSALGYLSLSAGLLIGYPWAIDAWSGQAWWWDPKIGGSLTMWSLYTAYLHLGLYQEDRRRTTGLLGVVCFASLVFTYLLTYLIEGVHSVA